MKHYFNKNEVILYSLSVIIIVVSFYLFDKSNYLNLCGSLIGVTSIIFSAKGNPIGPFFMIIFSLFYGYISYHFTYYGEMITYIFMTLPMSLLSLIVWLKNPYNGSKREVTIYSIKRKEILYMFIITVFLTFIFYFILVYFNTANIIPSTLSIFTSFIAAYLTYKRSPYFALAYACNDIILIILWVLASIYDLSYIAVVACFIAFLMNDLYCFINWLKIKKRQQINM